MQFVLTGALQEGHGVKATMNVHTRLPVVQQFSDLPIAWSNAKRCLVMVYSMKK